MQADQLHAQFEAMPAEIRLAVIAHLLHRLTQEWYVHARVILEDNPRGAAAILEIAAECLGLVESFCPDLLEAPLPHESAEFLREAFLTNADLAREDRVHAAMASIAAGEPAPKWQVPRSLPPSTQR